jgi:hypothetical protein
MNKLKWVSFMMNKLFFMLKVSSLKRQNDELLMNTVQLESQLNKSKLKIAGTEEQLRKLENKISISDVNIANQVRRSFQT